MFGLDELLAGMGNGGLATVLGIAVLLGLRHATDPDHVTAIATLALDDRRLGSRRAGILGAAWGAGHATTLIALGLPVVLFGRALPERVNQILELVIGLLIVVLAGRLLLRWWRGYLHDHPHHHDGVAHAHPHMHEQIDRTPHPAAHGHAHDGRMRSPATAFGIGLIHGASGSAAVGVLLVAAVPGRTASAFALVVFACATAASMSAISAALGRGLGSGAARVRRLTPWFGVLGTLFGLWYALAAVGALPYGA